MSGKLRAQWVAFKASEPGHRFEDHYKRRHAIKRNWLNWSQVLHIGAGSLFLLVGLLMLVGPGPGGLFILLGFALLGSEFLPLAKTMDWAELKTLRPMRWARRQWRRLTRSARIAIAAGFVAMVIAVAFGTYKFISTT